MSELWLVRAPTSPVLIGGSHETLLYDEANGQGWAVVRRRIGNVQSRGVRTQVDREELSSVFGAFLHSMGYRLEQVGVTLPASLHAAITEAPAGAVGYGEGTLLRIDDDLYYGSCWRFDGYCAAVTSYQGTWVGLLAPESDDVALHLIETERPISW